MKRLPLFLLIILLPLPASAAEFDPNTIGSLKLWLRADKGVTTVDNSSQGGSHSDVSSWADQSGNKNHATNPNQVPASLPSLKANAIGAQPALRFEGLGGDHFEKTDWLLGKAGKPFDLNKATVFIVGRWNTTSAMNALTLSPTGGFETGRGGVALRRGTAGAGWFAVHNGGVGNVERLQTNEPKLDDKPHVLAAIFDKAKEQIALFRDGELQQSVIRNRSKLPLDPIAYIQIGGHGLPDSPGDRGSEWFFGGQIAEILVFDRVLSRDGSAHVSTNEFNAIGWYLQNKYGLPGKFVEPILPVDTDGDGIFDGLENKYDFLDPNDPDDAKRDQDNDGLSNGAEFKHGTNPNHHDTDRDGIKDGHEVYRHKTNPTLRDTDNDLLYDAQEIIETNTDPRKADTDGDGSPDGGERYAGTDPNDPKSKPETLFHTWDEEVIYGTLAVALDGTVLQFEQNRDLGQVEVKRSEDGGKTWSDPILVGKKVKIDGDMSDDGRYRGPHVGWSGLGNVCVDETSGDIMVFASDLKSASVLYRSKDHGKTWKTEDIVIKPDSNGWIPAISGATDPGITLRAGKHKGRLLVTSRVFVEYLNKGKGRRAYDKHYANAVYSDDGGKTWTPSAPFPLGGTGESGIVELLDGTIYHNSRTHNRPGNRRIAYSHDQGATWTGEHEDDELFDGPPDVYGCKAGLLRLPYDDRDILLFSAPGRKDKREDITVWISFTGGKTWPLKRLIRKGPGNYTWLAAGRKGTPSEGQIYLLAGKDWMARFNLAWLLEGAQHHEPIK